MALTTHTRQARARLVPAPEPPLAPFYDAVLDDSARRGPVARERFAVQWQDEAALRALGEVKRRALPSGLGRAVKDDHVRLGASEASLRAAERLSSGEAVCAIAGQQPAPMGGPLYAFHKIAAAVGLARRYEARTGIPCVPVFWMHGEDSDFAEIRSATVGDRDLTLHDVTLADDIHPEGGLVGAVPVAALASLETDAVSHWAGLDGERDVREVLERANGRARDLGDAYSALVLDLFGAQGIVVVDPRTAAFRSAARGVIDRYLANADALRSAAGRGGDAMERLAERRPLTDATLESFVFAVKNGVRHKASVDEAKAVGGADVLSPNVALRPVVQDAVLPTVAMACGPGEISYLGQLREVFEGLEVRPACAVPRFGATWLAPAARELLEASGADVAEVIASTDAVLRTLAERRIPDGVRDELERAQRDTLAALERFAETSTSVDASLPQMVESARKKMDYQFQRLRDGLVGKARHRLEREHPEWLRLRYHLLPGDRLQERRLASLEPVAYRGRQVIDEMCDLAESHAEALEAGRLEHLVIDL